MKKYLLLGMITVIFFFHCDPEKLLNFRKAPVINGFEAVPGEVFPFDTVYAGVSATNPEDGALKYEWSVSPEGGTFLEYQSDKIRWVAPVNGGFYSLKVKVSNEYKDTERSGSVTVLDRVIPVVRISAPVDGDYSLQYAPLKISAEAFHSNGIEYVSLYVNGHLEASRNGNTSNTYSFTFTPDSSFLGPTGISIEAVAKYVSITGKDSVTVNIEGVVLGKPAER